MWYPRDTFHQHKSPVLQSSNKIQTGGLYFSTRHWPFDGQCLHQSHRVNSVHNGNFLEMAEFIHWVCLTTGMCQDFQAVLQWRHECRLWWPPWNLIAPRPAGFIRILTHWQPSQLDPCGVSYWLVYVEVTVGWRPEGTSPRTFPKDVPPHPGWESQTNARAHMARLRPWKQQLPWPLTFSSPPRPEAGGKQASHPGRRLKKLPAVLVSHVCDSLIGSMLRKLLTIWEKNQYEFCNRICYEKIFPRYEQITNWKGKKSFPLLSLPLSRTHFRPMLLP